MNSFKLLLLTFVIVTWGYSWVLMKQALDYMMPLTFVALRIAVGGLVIAPLMLRDRSFRLSGFFKMDHLLLGIFQTAAMFGLLIYGMQFVTAGKTAVVLYTMPVWTSLLLHFFVKEKLSRQQWLGVLSGLAGIMCILGWDTLVRQDKDIIFGEILIMLGAVSWAAGNIIVKFRLKNSSPMLLNGYQQLIGVIFLIVLSVSTEGFFKVEWSYFSVYAVLFTGIVASAVNFSAWFYLLSTTDVNLTAYSSLLVPVCGLILDWAILGTTLDTGLIFGGGFIILGIYIISKR